MLGKHNMTMPPKQAPDERRTLALAVRDDFRGLAELIDRNSGVAAPAPELASLRAAAGRGLRLASQLLDAIENDASD